MFALGGVVVVTIIAIVAFDSPRPDQEPNLQSSAFQPLITDDHSQHAGQHRVPAHFENPKDAEPLKPTLDPTQFFGDARKAYAAAKEIPAVFAQLPCYCYCDESLGHKSLHTCYESDHSSHCVTCINEGIMAQELHKQGLSTSQIRDRINEKFSKSN